MKFYVAENAAYDLEDIHKIEKVSTDFSGRLSNKIYYLVLVYNNRLKETIVYLTEEELNNAFDEIVNILKGE